MDFLFDPNPINTSQPWAGSDYSVAWTIDDIYPVPCCENAADDGYHKVTRPLVLFRMATTLPQSVPIIWPDRVVTVEGDSGNPITYRGDFLIVETWRVFPRGLSVTTSCGGSATCTLDSYYECAFSGEVGIGLDLRAIQVNLFSLGESLVDGEGVGVAANIDPVPGLLRTGIWYEKIIKETCIGTVESEYSFNIPGEYSYWESFPRYTLETINESGPCAVEIPAGDTTGGQ
ncbi:hypothetical protein HZA57_04045 [Candidatus Poribacteria bacterium]|nr:hypothetical protein [Candidatus Poribacteria bacterium]